MSIDTLRQGVCRRIRQRTNKSSGRRRGRGPGEERNHSLSDRLCSATMKPSVTAYLQLLPLTRPLPSSASTVQPPPPSPPSLPPSLGRATSLYPSSASPTNPPSPAHVPPTQLLRPRTDESRCPAGPAAVDGIEERPAHSTVVCPGTPEVGQRLPGCWYFRSAATVV